MLKQTTDASSKRELITIDHSTAAFICQHIQTFEKKQNELKRQRKSVGLAGGIKRTLGEIENNMREKKLTKVVGPQQVMCSL